MRQAGDSVGQSIAGQPPAGPDVSSAIETAKAGAVGLAPVIQSAVLTSTQANSTVTPAVLTDHTFTIPAGRTAQITGQLIATAAAITTGLAYGIRVAQPASADGNAVGSAHISVENSSAASALGISDGDAFNVAANSNALIEVVGTDSVAGNNAAALQAVVKNRSTNKTTTVTIEFRSEVAASAITAQIGTSAALIHSGA